jgi:hypothetical protein
MTTKKLFATFTLLLVLTTFTTGVGAQSKPSGCEFCQKILGTWFVTINTDIPGFPTFQALYTFMPGRTNDEGTYIVSVSILLIPEPICLPLQGVWKKTGPRQYTLTSVGFCNDSSMNYASMRQRLLEVVTLSDSGDEITGSYEGQGDFGGGEFEFFNIATTRGTRMAVETRTPQP